MIIEKELKYMLCESDFYKLNDYLSNHGKFISKEVNRNYYTDTNNTGLKDHEISMKLRNISDERFQFTTKIKKDSSLKEFHIKEEYTTELDKETFYKILDDGVININHAIFDRMKNIKEKLHSCNVENVFIIDKVLETKRTKYNIGNTNIEFTLDENNYLDIIDYELEIELEDCIFDETQKFVLNLFEVMDIKWSPSAMSKTKRFKSLYKQNK